MATSKITSTTTGKYDQIFALSQGYLNKSFQQLWNNTSESLGLHKFVASNIMGKIDAEIGPPEIVVDISPSDTYVLFDINILHGKFELRDVDTGDDVAGMPAGGFDMAGSKISFKVDISAEKLDIHDAKHQDILDRLHEDASNYSLSRLYMDLTSADLTTFNGNESVLPEGVVNSNSNWMSFFSTWMTKTHNAHPPVNTLGYTLTALDVGTKPKTIDPTFLPTFNNFQTCEWRAQSGGQPQQGIPAGDNNCLLYLQMTKGDDVPSDLHYAYTGNMVDAGESGTLFISKKLFWDKWLLPQLRILNFKSYLLATSAHCSNNEISPDFEWQWKIGDDAAKQMGKTQQDNFYDYQPETNGYKWTPGNTHQEDHGGQWLAELKAVIDCETQNEIIFTPGSNKITFKCHIHSYIQRWTTAAGSGSADINADWSFDLLMTQISSPSETNPALVAGGLAIQLANVADPDIKVDTSGSSWGVQSAPDGSAGDIRSTIEGIKLKDIANSIEAGLSGLGHFILPGNGTFNMSKPTFNNNGDFLCHLDYLPTET